MNNGAHVLVVSRDQMLLQTRVLILGAYFQVEPAGRLVEAERALVETAFDLVVLCYSIPDDEYVKLVELIARQKRVPKVITLSNPASGALRELPHGEQWPDLGPYQLLLKAAEMLGLKIKPAGRAARVEAAAVAHSASLTEVE